MRAHRSFIGLFICRTAALNERGITKNSNFRGHNSKTKCSRTKHSNKNCVRWIAEVFSPANVKQRKCDIHGGFDCISLNKRVQMCTNGHWALWFIITLQVKAVRYNFFKRRVTKRSELSVENCFPESHGKSKQRNISEAIDFSDISCGEKMFFF